MTRPTCPECGFTVFNRRYPKCERCGVALPAGLAYTKEEVAAKQVREKAEDEARREQERRASRPADSWDSAWLVSQPFDADAG